VCVCVCVCVCARAHVCDMCVFVYACVSVGVVSLPLPMCACPQWCVHLTAKALFLPCYLINKRRRRFFFCFFPHLPSLFEPAFPVNELHRLKGCALKPLSCVGVFCVVLCYSCCIIMASCISLSCLTSVKCRFTPFDIIQCSVSKHLDQ